jgi:hypothetical protein
VRQRVAQANAVNCEAYARQRQLEDALSLQQSQFEELARSQSMLAEATKALLQRFRDRDRALVAAEERVRALAERNARLEAGGDHAGAAAKSKGPGVPQPSLAPAEDTAHQDWLELARLLSDFVERKTSFCRAAPRASSAG